MEKEPKQKKAKKSMGREILEWVLTFVVPIVLVLLLHNYVFTFATVSETSMLETLQDHQWMAVSRIHYRLVQPERGDIVTCHYPGTGDTLYVKRIIALPGDTLSITDGVVCVNGETLDEPYVVYPSHETIEPFTLQENELFVMGDNRAVSLDCRSIGPIQTDDLHGFVFAAVYPFSSMQWFA